VPRYRSAFRSRPTRGVSRRWRRSTETRGVWVTLSQLYEQPYALRHAGCRRCIPHRRRVAWNIVTSDLDRCRRNLGWTPIPPDPRYESPTIT